VGVGVRGEDQQRYKIDEAFASGAMLLGRVTYEMFSAFWPTAPNDEGLADRMNGMPKYVVFTTLRSAKWNNTTIIKENVAEEIAKLKEKPGDDIVLYGSSELLRSLTNVPARDEIWYTDGNSGFYDIHPTNGVWPR